MAGWCENCASGRPYRGGLCVACYFYRRRTGQDRPEGLIIRKNVRAATRQFEEKAWGGPVPDRQPSEGERLRARAEEAARERRERRSR